MSRESSVLKQRLAADDVGRGGDGRELQPRDNGGPVMSGEEVTRVSMIIIMAALATGATGALIINEGFREELEKFAERVFDGSFANLMRNRNGN